MGKETVQFLVHGPAVLKKCYCVYQQVLISGTLGASATSRPLPERNSAPLSGPEFLLAAGLWPWLFGWGGAKDAHG